ncbi:hypothetical protein HZF02_32625 (plasmid) [Pseudomonas yamanorum]|nr:hypothetical protein HZF02_32625 [Pseudomonas yamanorum]
MTDPYAKLTAAAHSGAFGLGSKRLPTAEQVRAGNYPKGSVRLHGLTFTIETPMFTPRSGKDDGKPWSIVCMANYGYLNGYKGADGDAFDVYVGPIPESSLVVVVNQVKKDRSFDEHKAVLGFQDVESALAGYRNSYERGWQGLGSYVVCTIKQFKAWLKSGDLTRPLEAVDLIQDEVKPMTGTVVTWGGDNLPVGQTLGAVMYGLRRDDADNLLLDSVTMADITEYLSDGVMLDAMVIQYAQFDRKSKQLLRVMQAASGSVKAESVEVSQPFKNRGTTQVAMLFTMSDGQTVSVFFHNPDSTPNRLTPTDEMISWKWVQNKKDITVVVAPERGQDINPRQVARRIMMLVEKNSAKFIKAAGTSADKAAQVEELKGQVQGKLTELQGLDEQIAELQAKVDQLPAPNEDSPGGAAAEPEVPAIQQKAASEPQQDMLGDDPSLRDNRTDLEKLTEALKAGNVMGALGGLDAISGVDELREVVLKAGFSLGANGTKDEILASVGRDLVQAAKAKVDGFGLRALKNPVAPDEFNEAYPAWETAMIEALAQLLAVDYGDASGVALAQDNLVSHLYVDKKSPQDAAQAVLEASQAAASAQEEPEPIGDDDTGEIAPEGRENTVKTAKGTKVVTGFKVIEAKNLIISHEVDGTPNPDYPSELQPRDRARATSQAWVQKTARDLDPDSLGRTTRADSGAPIVGPDRVVESGNGRGMAIREAYRIGKADEYREWLLENADYFKVSAAKIQSMKAPVLVRVRISDVDRAVFAVEANQDDKLAMTATEKARSDAKRLDAAMMAKLADGDLTSASNRDFISAFLQSLGDTEAAQYMTTDGRPTASLISRVQAALFAGAYSDDRLLELTADSSKPEIANIVSALNMAAPDFMRAKELDVTGAEDAGEKVTDSLELSLDQEAVNAIISATNVLRQAKESGLGVDEFLRQGDMFGDVAPSVAAMAMFISKNNRSAKRLGSAFKAMAQFVESEARRKQTAGLFGDQPASFADIVSAANAQLEKEFGEGVFAIEQSDLFNHQPPAPVEPPPLDNDKDDALNAAKAYLDSVIEGTADMSNPDDVMKELERIYSAFGEGELSGLFADAAEAFSQHALKATAEVF